MIRKGILINLFVLCPDGKTICLEVNPTDSIAKIQHQILEKIKAIHYQNSITSIQEQKQKDIEESNVLNKKHLISAINSYWIVLNSKVCKFIVNNSFYGSDDMILIYNGKVLCPHNSLIDYYNPYRSSSRRNLSVDNVENFEMRSTNSACNAPPITIHASYPVRGGCFMISFSILMTIFFAVCMSLCTCGFSLVIIPILAPLLFILPLFCL